MTKEEKEKRKILVHKEKIRNNVILIINIISLLVLFASYRHMPSSKLFISQCLFLSSYLLNYFYYRLEYTPKVTNLWDKSQIVISNFITDVIAIALFLVSTLGAIGYGIISFSTSRILYLGNCCTYITVSGHILSIESIEIICLIILNIYLEHAKINMSK